ncbi:MAG: anaerobic ribonucleoside-triphosphate reductase activating protein [Bacteroidales bacterium]|jgi:pyruvate formate lyase activating enzyme
MRIGGFVKNSLVDWEGKVAAVIFTKGCNFRCGYCHNPSLVLPELMNRTEDIAEKTVLDFLAERNTWLDGVVVTGGEPTIHRDLPVFLEDIKLLGYPVKLDTNGTNPFMLQKIIKNKLADYIAMDVKILPEKSLYGKITGIQVTADIIEKIMTSILLLNNTATEVEFRTTIIPGIHDEAAIELIHTLLGNNKKYRTNQYRNGSTIETYL